MRGRDASVQLSKRCSAVGPQCGPRPQLSDYLNWPKNKMLCFWSEKCKQWCERTKAVMKKSGWQIVAALGNCRGRKDRGLCPFGGGQLLLLSPLCSAVGSSRAVLFCLLILQGEPEVQIFMWNVSTYMLIIQSFGFFKKCSWAKQNIPAGIQSSISDHRKA